MEELKNELKYYDEKAMYDQVIAEQDEKLAEQDAIIATLRSELQKLSGKAS